MPTFLGRVCFWSRRTPHLTYSRHRQPAYQCLITLVVKVLLLEPSITVVYYYSAYNFLFIKRKMNIIIIYY